MHVNLLSGGIEFAIASDITMKNTIMNSMVLYDYYIIGYTVI